MPSPTYQTKTNNTATSTSVTLTEPAGGNDGDGYIAQIIVASGGSAFTGLSGWTQRFAQAVNSEFTALCYTIRRSGTPNLVLSWTGSVYYDYSVHRISGVAPTGDFIESITFTTPGTGTVLDSPAATLLTPNTLVLSVGWLWHGFVNGVSLITPPTGYTAGFTNTAYDQGNAWKQVAAAGVEDPGVWSATDTSDGMWANTIVIASQAGGGNAFFAGSL